MSNPHSNISIRMRIFVRMRTFVLKRHATESLLGLVDLGSRCGRWRGLRSAVPEARYSPENASKQNFGLFGCWRAKHSCSGR